MTKEDIYRDYWWEIKKWKEDPTYDNHMDLLLAIFNDAYQSGKNEGGNCDCGWHWEDG